MELIEWSCEQDNYNLNDNIYLQKADKLEWGIYCSVYYSSEYNAFFKEDVYDFHLQREPFWICKGDNKVGGVVIAPNILYFLFFIPPFNDEGQVLDLLKGSLIKWSDPSKPINAYEILQNQVDLFARAGFWPDEFRCRWMQRPTEIFAFEWDDSFIVIEPQIQAENNDKVIKNNNELGQFFYESYAGGISAVRRKQESLDFYISWVGSFPYQTNDILIDASSLVYDKQTKKLVGACLVSLEGNYPAIFNIAVLPGFNGKGIATKMLKKALNRLKGHYPVLRLYVLQGNTAESVYYKLGFMPGPLEIQKFYLPHKQS
ncbi:GNAT family N-acetyltransferase [Paenibacillus macquariensis]|uniref:Acetyltransferase (GNAT) domain-containing protein n=1 Tax=Paenibacillus macquariensis TaxID=948756 RepID=A0ABY1JPE7_9BACL|nr:GNAT family N-acetyltransferase [Paenibacillus macquariensis]MEC0091982.1 GNAT family N-acetyltransferase [Paenibacillus macquariensis]OAB37445.1 hypothetical protein PMSM_05115 [Paenibacillus macquariensis subsp. macquariensis]SIQ53378.1 Acetyltransferase (GNAT) domain-containing protein [Paenibacillus macquariensis]